MLLKFVVHHLWDLNKRNTDPDHGMPISVEQNLRAQRFLNSTGPHAPDTVRRRLASWSTLTRWQGLTGAFASPALKSAIRFVVRATPRPRKRKSTTVHHRSSASHIVPLRAKLHFQRLIRGG